MNKSDLVVKLNRKFSVFNKYFGGKKFYSRKLQRYSNDKNGYIALYDEEM